jgi:hypothetical protein
MVMDQRRWGTVMAVMVLTLLTSACGMFGKNTPKSGEDAEDDIAAEEPVDQPRGSVFDLLDEDERDAVQRSGISGPLMDSDDATTELGGPFSKERRNFEGEPESKADKAGKLGISVLSVALSVAAVAAPFLLF